MRQGNETVTFRCVALVWGYRIWSPQTFLGYPSSSPNPQYPYHTLSTPTPPAPPPHTHNLANLKCNTTFNSRGGGVKVVESSKLEGIFSFLFTFTNRYQVQLFRYIFLSFFFKEIAMIDLVKNLFLGPAYNEHRISSYDNDPIPVLRTSLQRKTQISQKLPFVGITSAQSVFVLPRLWHLPQLTRS